MGGASQRGSPNSGLWCSSVVLGSRSVCPCRPPPPLGCGAGMDARRIRKALHAYNYPCLGLASGTAPTPNPPPRPVCRGVLTAVGHTLTAVMGAGILNLPYAISMLGWVAGPVCILVFAWITLYTSQLLADCAVINGRRQRNYTEVVYTTFGKFGCHLLGWWVPNGEQRWRGRRASWHAWSTGAGEDAVPRLFTSLTPSCAGAGGTGH